MTSFTYSTPLIIVISGTSGSGKDTVIKRLREEGLSFHFVVTATSRPPRPGEVDGVDYIFVSKDRFEQMIREGELIEHAMVYGEHKGVPRDQVEQALGSGQDVVMRLDVQGASTVRRMYPEAVLVFLAPEGLDEAANRLGNRNGEPLDLYKLRLDTASEEFQRLKEFDYLVINRRGRLEETVETVKSIIRAEHQRVSRQKELE